MGDNENIQTGVNKSDIENLEKKVDSLDKKVEKLSDNTPSKDNFKQLETTIRKVLLEGNGNKPLTIRVNKNHNMIQNNQSRISRMYTIIATIGSIALAGIGNLFVKWFG